MNDEEHDPRRLPWNRRELDRMPDVRDGLTRVQRVILYCLHEAEKDFPGKNVPTATLYGRVVEHINIGVPEFQRELARMVHRPNRQ